MAQQWLGKDGLWDSAMARLPLSPVLQPIPALCPLPLGCAAPGRHHSEDGYSSGMGLLTGMKIRIIKLQHGGLGKCGTNNISL